MENLVPNTMSEGNGFARKHVQWFGSTEGIEIPNHNDQNCPRFAWTPHPTGGSPVPKFQTCFVFRSLNIEI